MQESECKRKRLPRDERERLILDEAVQFFAENGFEGQTRALADRLGVTQPLLYRYFPDKETLIDRVFDEVYIKKWLPEWDVMIRDRSLPLIERLIKVYQSYYKVIFKSEFVRIFLFSGLKGGKNNERYIALVQDHIIIPLCEEFRIETKLDNPPSDDLVFELAWSIHGIVAQLAIRIWVYNLPAPESIDEQIDLCIRSFMTGMTVLFQERSETAKIT